MLKATLSYDVLYESAPVFTYNSETGNFECGELFYHFAEVMNDPSWQVYATDGKLVYPIQNMDRAPETAIFNLVHGDDKEETKEK